MKKEITMGRYPGLKTPPCGLEELPRPVVTFLMNGCKQEPRDALIECLRGLAEDGVVRCETDAAGLPAFRVLSWPPRSGRPLLAFEEVALVRLRKRANRLGSVTCSALVTDDGDDYQSWAQLQREELGQAAQQAGLAVKSARKGSWLFTFGLIAAAACTVLVVHGVNWKAGDKIAWPVFTGSFLLLLVPLFLRRWRLTPAGVAAVASVRSTGLGGPGMARGLYPDSGQAHRAPSASASTTAAGARAGSVSA
jgi:hypothetical protein